MAKRSVAPGGVRRALVGGVAHVDGKMWVMVGTLGSSPHLARSLLPQFFPGLSF